eukprot:755843-Hanusia_phi.AAC.4
MIRCDTTYKPLSRRSRAAGRRRGPLGGPPPLPGTGSDCPTAPVTRVTDRSTVPYTVTVPTYRAVWPRGGGPGPGIGHGDAVSGPGGSPPAPGPPGPGRNGVTL